MASLQVNNYELTQEQVDQITNDVTQITIRTVWNDAPPAGWEIMADGPLGSVIVCAKPCNKVQMKPPTE